jgi:hypothetical protein
MAKYNVVSGEIQPNYLYKVVGDQSVVYNGTAYSTNSTFRGVLGVSNFTFSGTGTQILNQLTELYGVGVEFGNDSNDLPVFPETTTLKGFGVEFVQQGKDIIFNDTTTIKGFSFEFVDHPIYAFQIITKRL